MDYTFFDNTFKNLEMPVLVCREAEGCPVVYANISARLLMDPMQTVDALREEVRRHSLADTLSFASRESYSRLMDALATRGTISAYRTRIKLADGSTAAVELSGNRIVHGGEYYIVLYVTRTEDDTINAEKVNGILSSLFQIANHTESLDDTINAVLAFVGDSAHVSRVYIFEEIDSETTANTYEWCAQGIEPAIQDLQNLNKEDYNYDVIVGGGMYITDDVRDLPEMDRAVLEPQGIKALAILPLIYGERALGYVGFDDCDDYRKWSSVEISLLKQVVNILVSLLVRRNAQRQVQQSLSVLETITESIDNLVYVNDIKTYELVFVNKTLADSLHTTQEKLLGKKCWQVLQAGQTGPCDFCPIPKMKELGMAENGQAYTWETRNSITKQWYLVKDSFIKWIDGRSVHIETGTDITGQKEYESTLERYASIDNMTGAYNREWGFSIMSEALKAAAARQEAITLVFIDLDGLKFANDTYGHDMGDQMIVGTTDIIRGNIRKSDLLCRWGGDEFILLLNCERGVAERLMGNITDRMNTLNEAAMWPYKLSFSYGMTQIDPDNKVSLDHIITDADKMMYENKMSKRR